MELTSQTKIIIGGLLGAVAILSVALGVVLINGDDHHVNAGNDGYMGMMQAMGRMDSEQMLSMMRSVLGNESYQRMVDHIAEHRNGTQSTYDNSPSGMMHQMMDGMMQRMPDDSRHSMPMMSQ
jgi:hypothetical protein